MPSAMSQAAAMLTVLLVSHSFAAPAVWFLGDPDEDCNAVCRRKGLACEESAFGAVVTENAVKAIAVASGTDCEHYAAGSWAGVPERSVQMMTGAVNCFYADTSKPLRGAINGTRCPIHSRKDTRICPCGPSARPGNSNYCDGKCTTPCAAGQVCQFQFNGMGQKPTCGCAVPRTRPSGPHTRPTRPPGPRPTRTMPGMRACADIRQGTGSTPEDEASCDSWSLCKQHRRTPTFVPGTGDEEDSCCCSEPSDSDEPAGDSNQFCCAITSAPEPKASCSIMDVKPCSQGFATAAIACKSAITDAKSCNIMAPQNSQAYKDCTEIFTCMKTSFGKSFGKCCNCINAFATKFKESQFQLDCTAA